MVLLLAAPSARAQFSSGSNGSYGPLDVTENTTLDLPADGIFHCTTITIAQNTTLRFNRNALNTPVYLLATGDVTIDGTIDVSGTAGSGGIPGQGGPGGFDGGFGAFQGFPAGDGQGPGGGPNRYGGVFAAELANNTNVYGNTLLSPLIGGSGGAAGANGAGGGGGGAILVASSTKISLGSSGRINSLGGNGPGVGPSGGGGGGSGGAIRLVAPIVEGSGTLYVDGGRDGNFGDAYHYEGSFGRTRIDTEDRFAHRNITLAGKGTRGSQMFVFPPEGRALNIIQAAGTDIPEDSAAPVIISLPLGSPTTQTVRVQARNFTEDVPIRVRITPENAASAVFDGVIAQASGDPPFADIEVELPLDTVCYVHAWTR